MMSPGGGDMPRRGNREGTFRWEPPTEARKYGRWKGQLLVTGVGRLTVNGRKGESKASVRERLHVERDQYAGVSSPARGSLAEWLDQWLRLYCRDLAPRTRESYADVVKRHLLPALGHRPIGKLTPDELLMALDRIERSASRRYAYAVLRIALGRAVKTGRIRANVCTMIDPPKVTYRKVTPPTPEQVAAILDVIRGERDEALIVTALATGLRQGEVVGLRWMDLEPDRLHVRGQRNRKREYVGAKRDSERVAPLPAIAAAALDAHRHRVTLRQGGQPDPESAIFTDAHGRPMTGFEAYRRWQVALRAAGVPAMPMHATRHFYATSLSEEQRDTVARLLGHKRSKVTEGYTHLSAADWERATDRINEALGG
jgi:integrase